MTLTKNKNSFLVSLFLLAVNLIPVNAKANIVSFIFDQNQYFNSVTNSTSIQLPNLGTVGQVGVADDLTFQSFGSDILLFGTGTTAEWSTLIPGADIAVSGKEDFQISGPGMLGMSFLVHEPTFNGSNSNFTDTCNAQCAESIYQISVFDNQNMLDSIQIGLLNDALTFVGISSKQSFNRVVVNEIVGTFDNEFFGGFTVTPVPEPETYAMFLAGLGLLGFASRKKKM